MGVKILGTTTAGLAPTAAQLPGERELALNSTDGKLFTNIGGVITIVATDRGVAFKGTTTYAAGDIVSDDADAHNCYVCIAGVTGEVPNGSVSWKPIDTINVETAGTKWVTGAVYTTGDIVSNAGILYIAKDDHTAGATFSADLAAHWNSTVATQTEVNTGADSVKAVTPLTLSSTTIYGGTYV